MEAINYAGGANMRLPPDAQFVQGVSGNALYLPAGSGKVNISGDRNELTISLWRQWDGVVDSEQHRGIFKTANIKVYFDQETDFLTVELEDTKTVTDIKDDQEQAHWCFLFAKNGFFKIYKNAELKAEITVGNYPMDFSEGLKLGGGRTHATFDEFRFYKKVVTEPEIRGLCFLVTKGTQVQQLENIIAGVTPRYLGLVQTVPTTRTAIIMKGERLGAVDANPGDWVLSGRTIGGWKVGVCYRWSGAKWINLEPEVNYAKEYHACLLHLFQIEELKNATGRFGALFAQVLAVQEAFIEKLVAQEAFIKKLSGDVAFLNSLVVKQLLIDNAPLNPNNFEMKINENDGIRVKNGNKVLFEVSPQGKTFFSGELDCQGFKVVNTGTNESSTVLFSWNAGDNGIVCAKKILKTSDLDVPTSTYWYDNPKIEKFYGKGMYGNTEIRCVRLKRHTAKIYLNIRGACVELLNNEGAIVAVISATQRREDNVFLTWITNDDAPFVAYKTSLYNFTFKAYALKQKIYFPAVNYGKPNEANVVYKDENGFLKIS